MGETETVHKPAPRPLPIRSLTTGHPQVLAHEDTELTIDLRIQMLPNISNCHAQCGVELRLFLDLVDGVNSGGVVFAA